MNNNKRVLEEEQLLINSKVEENSEEQHVEKKVKYENGNESVSGGQLSEIVNNHHHQNGDGNNDKLDCNSNEDDTNYDDQNHVGGNIENNLNNLSNHNSDVDIGQEMHEHLASETSDGETIVESTDYNENEDENDEYYDDGSSSEPEHDSETEANLKLAVESKLVDDQQELLDVARALISEHIEKNRVLGVDPTKFTKDLGFKLELEEGEDDVWGLIKSYLTKKKIALHLFCNYIKYKQFCRPFRKKLQHINSLEDAVNLISKCKNIVVVTGAGVSVSCGIPDFRSKGGVYDTIEKKYNLPEPESLFDIRYLREDPRPFFEFAKEIYPGSHKPSPTHYFLKKLDEHGKLLRNYTQNIDTLEHIVGITSEKLVNCHGSFKTATCVTCNTMVEGAALRDTIMKQEIPYCVNCNNNTSFMKPDIVFFGENLPDRFDQCVGLDRDNVDLLIVMGSSLKVQPVALIPEILDSKIPQILINREIVGQPHEFDYVYLGDCDNFVKEIDNKVDWTKS
ncbi:NAD+-dependent deacetylase [Heterostelium album PN500]|uniref:NAD+-dependent deacetylase n=1 Tax=Heterostelium pallidum (strain ATCC 26659 / Pp 5 / PN500) TaxID=670386 RepID=D3BEI1_HETP5|nr:NAD+-dependent deacetylase [Heterostelium album PN500]EFA80312.1 NAD+-dependent deacetylase [Heterostelium album PN500]|eukprot:XP_020432432.1 NAD+-dependent deacetylase [Heterostelium album PN500]